MKYDIFISYRRKESSGRSNVPMARTFKLEFERRGYKVFFDYSECTDNYFSETILPAIRTCDYFVLILTEDCMSRCFNEGDWVRREIEEALANNRKIIPITPDKECSAWPNLPDSLKKLDGLQITTIYTDHMFEDCVGFLIKNRFSPSSNEKHGLKPQSVAKTKSEKSLPVLRVLTTIGICLFVIGFFIFEFPELVGVTGSIWGLCIGIVSGIIGEVGLICFNRIKVRGMSWWIVAVFLLVMLVCFWFSRYCLILIPSAVAVPIIAVYLKIWKLQYSNQTNHVRLFLQPFITFLVLLLYVAGLPVVYNGIDVHCLRCYGWYFIMIAGAMAEIGLFFYKPRFFKFLPWIVGLVLVVMAVCYMCVDYSTYPKRDILILTASAIPVLTMMALLLINVWKPAPRVDSVTS